MLILLWLLPPIVVTAVAMVWVGWIGRERPAMHERSETAQAKARQRFAEAILRETPATQATPFRRRPRERSTGVAVRRTRSG